MDLCPSNSHATQGADRLHDAFLSMFFCRNLLTFQPTCATPHLIRVRGSPSNRTSFVRGAARNLPRTLSAWLGPGVVEARAEPRTVQVGDAGGLQS